MLTACSRTPRLSDPAEPLPPFADRVAAAEKRYNAYVGLFAVDLATGRTLSNRADDRFALCSTFKTYAAARVLQMAAAGALSIDDQRPVGVAPFLPNSPITEQHAGGLMTLRDLCAAALQHSDNTAANVLLQTIGGPPAVTAFARSIGDSVTQLDRWETALNSAVPGDLRDTSTPRALGTGYRELLTGTTLPEPQRAQLESWMRGNVTSVKSMRAGLPSDWTTADKSGAGAYGSTNAVGIAFGPTGERLLLSVMTRSRADDPGAANLQPLIAEVVAQTLPYLRNQG
ncbi:MAG TPA: class A beta-lactamase [Mycobacterium sp.]|nr:class A beta-lactamase [Mycobacterium sp.]